MPGIVGIIGSPHDPKNEASLRVMLGSMQQEPFYTTGSLVRGGMGLWVGWSNHRGSFSDCLPIWNERRDVCLLFFGEDFTEDVCVRGLKEKGHAFAASDASYLVHLYEEKGLGFLESLNGWFSGVLVDIRENKIVLFNDRYGLQRMHYCRDDSRFYFASEAKSLLSTLPKTRALDMRSFAEACACGCALQNRTIFSSISLLPGGSKWSFNPDQEPRFESYFDPRVWENQELLTEDGYYCELKDTFARILPRYLRDGRRLGMSLTGGLDGRMIMAWAKPAPGTLPCYTFGGPYRDCTDVKVGRKVARTCGQPHKIIPVNGNFIGEFPALAEKTVYASDGAMDVSASVDLYANRVAREIAPTRLTGNYGSEILRGSIAFKPKDLNGDVYGQEFVALGRTAAETYASEMEAHPVSFIAFKQVPWHHFSRLSVEQSQLTVRAPYLDNELVRLMYRAPRSAIDSKEPSLRLIAEGNRALSRIPTDRGVRYPPLPLITRGRHFYEEFTFRAEYAYDYGMPQWLSRIDHVFTSCHFERLFLGRHKFAHFRVWYRDKLGQYIKDILLDPRTRSRGYLNGDQIEVMVKGHLQRGRNYTTEIHKILTAELIQTQLVERRWD